MSDLVSRLLEAIQAKEEKARAADGSPWAASMGAHPNAVFIADNDPSSVLRRCQRDRTVVDAYVEAKKQADRIFASQSFTKGYSAGLEIAVKEIAFGYGITEEEK